MAASSEKIDFETKQEPVFRDSSLKQGSDDEHEVFKAGIDGVEYRTVTWQRAIIIFIKTQIAIGVLGVSKLFWSHSDLLSSKFKHFPPLILSHRSACFTLPHQSSI